MESEQVKVAIVPPVIVDEKGDVQPYPSVASAIRAIEAVDVSNGEYAFYDSTGRVLEAQVRKGKVSLVPTSKFESESAVLRGRILQVLSMLGVAEESLSSLPFSDLAQQLLRAFRRE